MIVVDGVEVVVAVEVAVFVCVCVGVAVFVEVLVGGGATGSSPKRYGHQFG